MSRFTFTLLAVLVTLLSCVHFTTAQNATLIRPDYILPGSEQTDFTVQLSEEPLRDIQLSVQCQNATTVPLPTTSSTGLSTLILPTAQPRLGLTHCIVAKGAEEDVGRIFLFAGVQGEKVCPGPSVPCDGALLENTTYPDLFAALSWTYTAVGGTGNFSTPNLQGRTAVGWVNSAPKPVGVVVGSSQNTITVDNLPAHAHNITGSALGEIATDSTGSGTTLQLTQESVRMNYIIKLVGDRVGEVRIWAPSFLRPSMLANWTYCDGRLLNQTLYPELFALIGHTYEDGTETPVGDFRVPNLEGKIVVSQDGTEFVLGKSGGRDSVQLTWEQLPTHTHTAMGEGLSLVPVGSDNPTSINTRQPYLAMQHQICVNGLVPTFGGITDDAPTSEPYLSEVRIFAGISAANWASCDGTLLQVADYGGLYSQISTNYSSVPSDGSFNVPELRGKAAVQPGGDMTHAEGVVVRTQSSGIAMRVFDGNSLPAHVHTISIPGVAATVYERDGMNNQFTFSIVEPASNSSFFEKCSYSLLNDTTPQFTLLTPSPFTIPVSNPPTVLTFKKTMNQASVLIVPAPGILTGATTGGDAGDVLSAQVTHTTTNGTLSFDSSSGAYNYTPAVAFVGQDSFDFSVTDGFIRVSSYVNITVIEVSHTPIAHASAYSTNEDTTLTINAPGLLADVLDPDNSPTLTAVLDSTTQHGTLTFGTAVSGNNASGSFIYKPSANFNGLDFFYWHAWNGVANSTSVRVNITVISVLDPPVANADSYTTPENTKLDVAAPGVLSNDVAGDGTAMQAVLGANVTHGALTLNVDGSFSYTPSNNYSGTDSFTYYAKMVGGVQSTAATVTITVQPINHAPVASPASYTIAADTVLTVTAASGVLSHVTDQDASNTLTAAVVTTVSHGTLVLKATDGSFIYTPSAQYSGSDSFTYKANDGTTDSNIATVTITVTPVVRKPVANADRYANVTEGGVISIAAPGVLTNDTVGEGTQLTATLVSSVSFGNLTFNPDGSFLYIPQSSTFAGVDSFTYKANDGVDSNVATVSLQVGNPRPVGNADSYSVQQGSVLQIPPQYGVLINDTDANGLVLRAILAAAPLHGTAQMALTGAFIYSPDSSFSGVDTFSYILSNGKKSAVAPVWVTIQVVPLLTSSSTGTGNDTDSSSSSSGVTNSSSSSTGNTNSSSSSSTGEPIGGSSSSSSSSSTGGDDGVNSAIEISSLSFVQIVLVMILILVAHQ